MSDIIYRSNKKGFFTYVNPTAQHFTGYNSDELLTMHFTDLVSPSQKDTVAEFYKEQITARSKSSSVARVASNSTTATLRSTLKSTL